MKTIVVLILISSSLSNADSSNTVQNVALNETPNVPLSGRIVNGWEAIPHSAPYIVSLRKSPTGGHYGAGTIISAKTILTAAHCVAKNVWVVAGLHEVNNGNGAQVIQVKDSKKQENGQDIALMFLKDSIKFNDRIKSIPLPPSKYITYSGYGVMYGWGGTYDGSPIPDKLQAVVADLLTYDQCQKRLPGFKIHPSTVCAGPKGQRITACYGDSGGPLIAQLDTGRIIVGVISSIFPPCGSDSPTLAVGAVYFNDWIKKHMK